jgi:hypothetical protein
MKRGGDAWRTADKTPEYLRVFLFAQFREAGHIARGGPSK